MFDDCVWTKTALSCLLVYVGCNGRACVVHVLAIQLMPHTAPSLLSAKPLPCGCCKCVCFSVCLPLCVECCVSEASAQRWEPAKAPGRMGTAACRFHHRPRCSLLQIHAWQLPAGCSFVVLAHNLVCAWPDLCKQGLSQGSHWPCNAWPAAAVVSTLCTCILVCEAWPIME
jgi:hypothetical protein